MKEQLIKFSKEKGFLSKDNLITVNDSYYYLWMCELQKWLREVNNIDAFIVACYIGEDKHRYSYYITHPTDTDSDGCEALTYEEALEQALYECLQIVSETVA